MKKFACFAILVAICGFSLGCAQDTGGAGGDAAVTEPADTGDGAEATEEGGESTEENTTE